MPEFARYLNIRSATTPVLSPDGRRVAFLSDITGLFQAWSAPITPEDVPWPRQLTFFSEKVWELHGTAAAPHLIAVGDVGGNERQQFYLITGFGGDEGHEVHRLTTNDDAIHRFGAFSPDGQRVLYTCNERNGVDFDLYVLDVRTREAQKLREMRGNRAIAAWSPDERHVLVLDATGPLEDDLYLLDLGDPSAPEVHVNRGWTPARFGFVHWTPAGIYLLTDAVHDRGALCRLDLNGPRLVPIVTAEVHDGDGELDLLAVAPQGSTALYTFNQDGVSKLWRIDLASGDRAEIALPGEGVVSAMRVRDDGQGVLAWESPRDNADIWLLSPAGELRQVTFSDRAGIASSSFISPQLIRYETFDGRRIPAWLFLPHTPPPAGGYPCILYVHGGPTSQLRPEFDVRFQYFLHRGYAILAPNVRGSTGYGREYAALDEVEKRMDSVADLKHAVLWLHERPEINPKRIAIYGRSYGGFMVLAALTEYPELFAAGIDVVGIANWVTFLEHTSPWRRAHREKEYGSLAHHRDVLERISPIHKADRIRAPLMVIAGDNDPRVPLSESEQIAERVRANGGVVEFLHYADEGHKISKLSNRIDSFTRMAAFLERYV
ncbi:MAG: S9 family peptidase [Anaerolineae bacterium]